MLRHPWSALALLQNRSWTHYRHVRGPIFHLGGDSFIHYFLHEQGPRTKQGRRDIDRLILPGHISTGYKPECLTNQERLQAHSSPTRDTRGGGRSCWQYHPTVLGMDMSPSDDIINEKDTRVTNKDAADDFEECYITETSGT